jgi:hypothetical protein
LLKQPLSCAVVQAMIMHNPEGSKIEKKMLERLIFF